MAYTYVANNSPRDRFNQLEVQLDNGTTAILKQGGSYDLSASELARARQFIVLVTSAGGATTATPLGVAGLPVKGVPNDGDMLVWSSSGGAFVPTVVAAGGGSITVQEEGSNLPARGKLNFVGSALTATDDSANARTNVTSDPLLLSSAVVDAKGDLLAASGADTVARLPIGANGQFLKADSTQSLGVAWTNLTAPSAYIVNIADYGAVADSTAAGTGTDNWVAFNSAVSAAVAAGGGFVFVPAAAAAYGVNINVAHGAFAVGPISVPTGVQIIGAGKFTSSVRVLNENLASPRRRLFQCPLDSNVQFRDLTLLGPAAIQVTSGGIVDMIEHLGRAGSITLENVRILGGSYACRMGAGGRVDVTARACEIGNMTEFGILTNAVTYSTATDKTRVLIDNVYFHDIGGVAAAGGEDVQSSGIQQQHAVYFPPLHNLTCRNSIFENITGYGVHCHGSVGAAAGDYFYVDNCEFRTTPTFDASSTLYMHGGIETSNRVTTKITGCQFNQTPRYSSITFNGDAIVDKCDFNGAMKTGGSAVHCKFESANISGAQAYKVKFNACKWTGLTGNDIWQPTNLPCTIEIDRSTFSSSVPFSVKIDPAATQTRLYVRNSTFDGAIGTAYLRLEGGFVAEVTGNHFYNPTGTWAIDNPNGTSSVYQLLFRQNEFSGVGAAIRLRTTPSLNPPVSQSGTNANISTNPVTTSGSLAAGTYYYKIAARNAQGESLASAETSGVLAATGKISVFFPKVLGATGYRIYRTTTSGSYTGVSYFDVAVASANSIQDFWDDTGAGATGTLTPKTAANSMTATFAPSGLTQFDASGNYGTKGYKTQNGGQFVGSTNASGLVTISHGLGSTETGAGITPNTVFATPQGSAYMISQENMTATDFTLGVHDAAGALVANTSVGITWKVEA